MESLEAMKEKVMFQKVEEAIVNDSKLLATLVSYVTIFLISLNLISIQSPILGVVTSVAYFVINATFLGNAFFNEKSLFLQLGLGGVLLIAIIGLIGWIILITYNLDAIMTMFTLSIAATLCSIANKIARFKFEIELVIEK